MHRPTYSALLGRLMTEEEMVAQDKYLAEQSAKVLAASRLKEKE